MAKARKSSSSANRPTPPPAPASAADNLVNAGPAADEDILQQIGCTAAQYNQYAEKAKDFPEWTAEIEAECTRLDALVKQSKKDGIQYPANIPPLRKYLHLVHYPSLRMKQVEQGLGGEAAAPSSPPVAQVIQVFIFRQ